MKNLSEITIDDLKEVYFGSVRYPKGGTHGPRIQRGIQLFHLLSGSVTFTIDSQDTDLVPGDVCLLLPGRHEFHQFSFTEESTHTWCQLDFYNSPEHFQTALTSVTPMVTANMDIKRFIELGLSLTRNQQTATHQSLLELGKSLLRYIIDYSEQSTSDSPIPRSVLVACDYINEHLTQPLELQEIATFSHVSINHLIVLFRAHLGITPSRYIWQLRCHRAAELLSSTSIAVGMIAEQTGFSSPYHFSKLFKQQFQVSPQNYRKGKQRP